MSLFDFFFPEQAQAMHLRTIAETTQREIFRNRAAEITENLKRKQAVRLKTKGDNRIGELEDQLAQSALVIESMIALLEEKKLMTRAELRARVADIDSADGVVDGKITPDAEKPFTPKRDWPG
jgi:hypothetical protein